MKKATLTINGLPFEFGHVWVHMQNIEGKTNAPYCATVLKPWCVEVFDPHKTKQSECSWKDFLMELVDEMGTFLLEAYFETMAKIVEDKTSGTQWVIATLDDVVECEEAIELRGKAVVFDPKRV